MTLLINAAYFRDECEVSQAVDDTTIRPKLVKAHDQLRFQLGKPFYDELVTQYSTTPTSFSSDNLALFDPYVKQFLAHQAYEYYTIRSNVNDTRTGFRVHRDNNSESAPDKVLSEIIRGAKEMSMFYKGEMINYIRKQQQIDSSKFPLYEEDCSNQRFGSPFHITHVTKIEDTYAKIDKKINNGY